MIGRKRIYGYEVLVLAAGAIAPAFARNIWWLIGFRAILGAGSAETTITVALRPETKGESLEEINPEPAAS